MCLQGDAIGVGGHGAFHATDVMGFNQFSLDADMLGSRLSGSHTGTNEGLRELSVLTGLASLSLRCCYKVTREGVEALRRDTAASNLHIQR
jgi:hypothetical protein